MLRVVNKKKRIMMTGVNLVGYAAWFMMGGFLRKHVRRQTSREVRKILAVRLAYIGDVIMTLPALQPLRERFPKAKLSFLVGSKAAEVLKNNPFLDEIITYDAPWFYPQPPLQALRDYVRLVKKLRKKKFDLVIDFRGDFRNILFVVFASGASRRVSYDMTGGGYLLTDVVPYKEDKHKVEFHLDIVRALGANCNGARITCFPSGHECDRVHRLLDRYEIPEKDLLVGIHPGSRLPLKNWEAENYATVADKLVEDYGAAIVIVGSAGEKGLADGILGLMRHKGINACGLLSLRELWVLIERMHLFLCTDSAPMHLASGANIPIVALFGPSEWWDTGPLSEKSIVQKIDLACRTWCDSHTCRHDIYQYCLKAIEPSDVLTSCRTLLANNG